jgi:hypothetical protein
MISAICPTCKVRKEVVVHTDSLMCLTCNTIWEYGNVKSSTLQPMEMSGDDEANKGNALTKSFTSDVPVHPVRNKESVA